LSGKPEEAKTDRYTYSVHQGHGCLVLVAKRLTGEEAKEGDLEQVKEELRDMGKWEALVCSISSLMQAVGFRILDKKAIDYHFGYSKYCIREATGKDIDDGPWRYHTRVSINLVADERRRRSKENSVPDEAEIIQQIGNISKWRNWKQSFPFFEQTR